MSNNEIWNQMDDIHKVCAQLHARLDRLENNEKLYIELAKALGEELRDSNVELKMDNPDRVMKLMGELAAVHPELKELLTGEAEWMI